MVLGAGISSAASPDVKPRPKIALALSGGAAYGLTQFGALEWLEQHRIPVDGIAGTSGGAIVGAWYATGLELLTNEEIARPTRYRSMQDMRLHGVGEMLSKLDLDALFRSYPNYSNVDLQDKKLQRAFPFGPAAGVRDGTVAFTDGIVPGQSLENLFGRICENFPTEYLYRDDGTAPFDRLPTSFRAIAVQPHGYDLHNWEVLTLGGSNSLPRDPDYRVSLPDAVRASMAIPYVFTPRYLPPGVTRDQFQYGLVDGGTRDNFPTDAACDAFKPDVVIGCRIYVDLNPLSDLYRLTGHPPVDPQIQRRSNSFKFGRTQASRPDSYLIEMDAGTVRPDRFDDWRHLAWLGYRSMEQYSQTPAGARLRGYQLSIKDYEAYRAVRRAKANDAKSFATVPPPSVKTLEQEASKTGNGSVGFERLGKQNQIQYHPRNLSDLQLYTNGEFEAGTGEWTSANLDLLARNYGFLSRKSSLNANIKLGTSSAAKLDVNLVPDHGLFFLQPYLGEETSQQSFFEGTKRLTNDTIVERVAGIELGALIGPHYKASLLSEIGNLPKPIQNFSQNLARIDVDTTNSNMIPTQGLKGSGIIRRMQTGQSDSGFFQAKTDLQWFVSQGVGNHFLAHVSAGTSFGAQPDDVLDFRLGGAGVMKGYPEDFLRSSGFVYGGLSYTARIEKIPFYIGNIDWTIGTEDTQIAGGHFDDAYTTLALITRMGTIFAGLSVSDHYHPRMFFGIGNSLQSSPKLFGFQDN